MIIGKQGEQRERITEASVSRQHCKITKIGNGRYLLEDLNSTNGTFVNGQRISVMEVDDNTIIQLGPKYSVRVVNLFTDIGKEFDKLKKVYDNYNSQKLSISKNIAKKNFQRSLIPSFISPIILFGSFLFSGEGQGLIIFRVVMAVVMVVSLLYTAKSAGKAQQESPEKNMQLEKKFRKEYVCPSCKRFLGNIPFEELRDSVQTCPYCKTKWH